MKVLEEYKQKKFKTKNVEPDCREAEAYLNGLDEGWKAALEWALKNLDQYVEEWDKCILDDIKEELEQ